MSAVKKLEKPKFIFPSDDESVAAMIEQCAFASVNALRKEIGKRPFRSPESCPISMETARIQIKAAFASIGIKAKGHK